MRTQVSWGCSDTIVNTEQKRKQVKGSKKLVKSFIIGSLVVTTIASSFAGTIPNKYEMNGDSSVTKSVVMQQYKGSSFYNDLINKNQQTIKDHYDVEVHKAKATFTNLGNVVSITHSNSEYNYKTTDFNYFDTEANRCVGLKSSSAPSSVSSGKYYDSNAIDNAIRKYSDVKTSHWAASNIGKMTLDKKLTGYPDGTFKPSGSMSRAEFINVVAKSVAIDKLNANAGDKWYDAAYTTLAQLDIMPSSSNLYKADPSKPISREEMAYLATRATSYLGENLSACESSKIPDYKNITDGYKTYVLKAYNAGILCGVDSYGTFKPEGNLTRAEACTVLVRIDDPTARVSTVEQSVAANVFTYNSAKWNEFKNIRRNFYSDAGDTQRAKTFSNDASARSYAESEYYTWSGTEVNDLSKTHDDDPAEFKLQMTTSYVSYDEAGIDPIYQKMLKVAGEDERFTGYAYHPNAVGDGYIMDAKGHIVPYAPVTRVEGEYFERVPCEGDVIIKKDGTRVTLKATFGQLGLFQDVNIHAGYYGADYTFHPEYYEAGWNIGSDAQQKYYESHNQEVFDGHSHWDEETCYPVQWNEPSLTRFKDLPEIVYNKMITIGYLYANYLERHGTKLQEGSNFYDLFIIHHYGVVKNKSERGSAYGDPEGCANAYGLGVSYNSDTSSPYYSPYLGKSGYYFPKKWDDCLVFRDQVYYDLPSHFFGGSDYSDLSDLTLGNGLVNFHYNY